MGRFDLLMTWNLGPSSVVLPVYLTSIMRVSPLPRQGAAEVPTPLEPWGQSSRSLGGASAVGATAGAALASAAALGLVGAASFLGSSSQPSRSAANKGTSTSFDDEMASDMEPSFIA